MQRGRQHVDSLWSHPLRPTSTTGLQSAPNRTSGKPEDLTLDKHHCQVNGHVHLDVPTAPDAPAGAASNAPVRQQLPCGAHLVGRNLSNALPVCSELATAAFCHLALTAYCRRVALRMWRSCEVLGRLHVGLA